MEKINLLHEFISNKCIIAFSKIPLYGDVGNISNLGGGWCKTLRGHFFFKRRGTFSKTKKALFVYCKMDERMYVHIKA